MTEHLLIDEVVEALYKKYEEYQYVNRKAPELVIYMHVEFYYDCMAEFTGGVSAEVYRFFHQSMIGDVRVFKVDDKYHPSWRIVEEWLEK